MKMMVKVSTNIDRPPSPSYQLLQICKEQGLDVSLDQDPIREQSLYLSRKQRQLLLDEHGVQGWTVVQFLGDSVLIPAGAMHQVYKIVINAQTLEAHSYLPLLL